MLSVKALAIPFNVNSRPKTETVPFVENVQTFNQFSNSILDAFLKSRNLYIPLIRNHDLENSPVFAAYPSASNYPKMKIRKKKTGIFISFKIANNEDGEKITREILDGEITGCSAGFFRAEEAPEYYEIGLEYDPTTRVRRYMHKKRALQEISLVGVGEDGIKHTPLFSQAKIRSARRTWF